MDQTDACPVANDDSREQEIPQNQQFRGESPPSEQFSSLNIQPFIHGQTENQHSSGRDETDAGGFIESQPQPQMARKETHAGPFIAQGSIEVVSQPQHAQGSMESQPQQAEYTKLDAYPMASKERGCFLIVDLQQDKRSEVDCGRLKQLGRTLGFRFIRVKKVATKTEVADLDKFLKRVGKADHSDYDCFFVVVLAFQERVRSLNKYTSKGGEGNIKMDTFITPFTASNSPKLKDKPKIVFVYAPNAGSHQQATDETDADKDENIPNHADFYISVCQPRSPEEAVRLKDGREDGSHFIWNLCRSFTKFQQKYDICSLMSVVNRETIKNMDNDEEVVKKIYWSRSQLTKILTFSKQVSEKNE